MNVVLEYLLQILAGARIRIQLCNLIEDLSFTVAIEHWQLGIFLDLSNQRRRLESLLQQVNNALI